MNCKQIQIQIKKKRADIQKAYTKLAELTALLEGICDHSETHDYNWEWDSGYGQQKQMIGKRCLFCNQVDRWKNGHFTKQ